MFALLSLVPRWVSITALASLALYALYVVKDYRDLAAEVAILRNKNQGQVNEITVLKANEGNLRDALASLDKRYSQRLGDLDEFCRILREVEDSTDPADNETVGGAVGKVLERLDKKGAKK